MKKNIEIKILGAILFVSVFLTSCGPSACDCANLRNDSPMKKNYTPEQIDDGDFMNREVDRHIEKAKNCAIRYGKLTEMDKEIARTAREMTWIPNLDQAIENANKECSK